MIDIAVLILTCSFVPFIVLFGIKIYSYTNYSKVFKGLTLTLLGLELLRFFYTASLYEKAVMPANDVSFSFISVLCMIALFAAFNSGKTGKTCGKILIVLSLVPIVFSLFNAEIYNNTEDIYAVTKALYFVEAGLIIALALIKCRTESKFSIRDLLFPGCTLAAAILINIITNLSWKTNITFGTDLLINSASVAAAFASAGIVYLLTKYLLIAKKNE